MKIEFYGECGKNGSSHPLWVFEIEEGCERILVTAPGFVRDQKAPKVWGFKAGKQVYGKLVEHDPEMYIQG